MAESRLNPFNWFGSSQPAANVDASGNLRPLVTRPGPTVIDQRGAIDQVTEEARGGDRLAQPLRRLGLFPSTMVQMISVGEETGRLGTMLLRVANMQEKLVRRHAATLISLLAPAMILGVGVLVGFIVISLLLPIFQMSQQVR